jgi:hypothetical protein
MNDASFHSANYYRGRERAERELADQACSIAIRRIHLELADRYRELAERFELPTLSQPGTSPGKQAAPPVQGEETT